jgi:hypothetical protein
MLPFVILFGLVRCVHGSVYVVSTADGLARRFDGIGGLSGGGVGGNILYVELTDVFGDFKIAR